MGKTLLLAWTMFRGTQWGSGAAAGAKRRKLNLGKFGNTLLFVFVAGYLITIVTAGVTGIYKPLASMGLQAAIPSLAVSMISLITFLFGVMYTMSVYYHSSDVDKLLPLPFTPGQIIFAKFLTTLLYEYLMVLLAGLPAMIAYGVLNGESAVYYIWVAVVALILPVTPLALASILVILLMRFSPAARNKDRFNMIANILIMAVTLGIVFGMQSLQGLDSVDLGAMLAKGAAELARVTAGVFPGSALAAAALADPGAGGAPLRIAGYLLVCAASIVLLMLFARVFYFKGVMGVGASYARHRRLSCVEMESFSTSGAAFWTYALKDYRILVRTPVFFMNNFLMNFLFPVFFFVPVVLSIGQEGGNLGALLATVREACFGADAYAAPIALGAFAAVTIFVCGMNGITASAISREGSCAYIMKYIPMGYRAQVRAKIAVGALVSAVPALILLAVALVLLRPPLWFIPLVAVVLAAALMLPNLLGILFDLRWPKLTWTDEQKAVKQNMNVLYSMVLSMFAAALSVVPAILVQVRLGTDYAPLAYTAAVGFPILADLALARMVHAQTPRLLRAMQA